VRSKGGEEDMLIRNARRRNETSRGRGIGENLGVKGVRERQRERERRIKFRIFSLARARRKFVPFLFVTLLFFISSYARHFTLKEAVQRLTRQSDNHCVNSQGKRKNHNPKTPSAYLRNDFTNCSEHSFWTS
jgi:hypothetical protein